MKKNLIYGLLIALVSIFFTSCKDKMENEIVAQVNVQLNYIIPKDLVNPSLSKMTVSFINVNTSKTISKDYKQGDNLSVEEGIYDISIEAKVSYETNGLSDEAVKQLSTIKGQKKGVNISVNDTQVKIDLFLAAESTGFVFEEIYFTGSKTPKGSQYNSDKFFEIYNNTDKILYADGLCISETAFLSTMKQDYQPNIMSEYVAVDAIYTIPGTGKDYPVMPGKSLLIADIAKNHTVDNPNSYDLSKADFEWFDDDKFGLDVDVPSVPNLIKTYSSSASIWSLHNGGAKSYVLFRMDTAAEEFLKANKYDYYYNFVWSGGSVKMDDTAFKVSNKLVIDAVGMSAPSKFQWTVMNPSLDMSYTHSGDYNAERYGKSVRRKVSHTTSEGRIVLMDTNNSAFDFIDTVVANPSHIGE